MVFADRRNVIECRRILVFSLLTGLFGGVPACDSRNAPSYPPNKCKDKRYEAFRWLRVGRRATAR